jgi:hypothetical protein
MELGTCEIGDIITFPGESNRYRYGFVILSKIMTQVDITNLSPTMARFTAITLRRPAPRLRLSTEQSQTQLMQISQTLTRHW